MDDGEEAIDVSGSPFAPASDYLGKRLGINDAHVCLIPTPPPPPLMKRAANESNSLRPQRQ